jgi:hypothetical protein
MERGKTNWNKRHTEYWKESLQFDQNRLSFFQVELVDKLREQLNNCSLQYSIKITDFKDFDKEKKEVKLVTMTIDKWPGSKLWIYNNMADFEIDKNHQVFEEWGYLKPNDLMDKYLESLNELLKE